MAEPHRHSPSTSAEPTEPRRDFLVRCGAGAVGAVAGTVPLAAGTLVFCDPLLRGQGDSDSGGKAGLIRLATVDSLPDNVPVRVPVIADKVDAWTLERNQPIGAVYLRKVPGENGQMKLQCFNAICPHAGCFVAYREDARDYLCPCHTSAFDLDGERLDLPGKTNPAPRPMDSLETEVRDGEVWVDFKNFYTGKHEKEAKP